MQYVKLGNAGVKVSRICLGCLSFGSANEWFLELNEARPILQRALDLGINFFDTANEYSRGRSEEIVGELLKDVRKDVVIGTKVYFPQGDGPNERGLSRVHIMQQINESLKRLQTDYVDLYQTHRWDYDTPIEETLRTLDNLVREGKVRYIGTSSMWAWQLAKALWTSERLRLEKFISMQPQYNLVYREEEREMVPFCIDQNIAIIPWSPLAGGFLTGKYKRDVRPDSPRSRHTFMRDRYFLSEDFDIVDRVKEMATNKGVKLAQVALAWLLHKDYITAPIVGVTRIEHLEDAVEALEIKLSPSDIEYLEEPYQPHSTVSQGPL